MNELIKRIISRLEQAVPDLREVHPQAHEDILPESTAFPCAGVKDGDIEGEFFGGADDREYTVHISVFVSALDAEGNILGLTYEKGILELTAAVRDALTRWDADGFQWQAMVEDKASVALSAADRPIQKKTFAMKWVAS